MKFILNGKLVSPDQAVVPVDSRAVSYGDGCFDTLRSYRGRFLMLDRHLERMTGAMNYLGMDAAAFPHGQTFRKHLDRLLAANDLEHEQAMVRTQVWREGGRGYHISEPSAVSWFTKAASLPDIPDFVALKKVETRRIPVACVNPRYKLSNGVNYIIARREASQHEADDALMLTTDGFISETTIANLFWYRDGVIYTPSDDCDLLPGITRDIVMELVENMNNVKLETGTYGFDVLKHAETAWICNSLREIVPVERVDDISFDTDHSLIKEIQDHFAAFREKHLA